VMSEEHAPGLSVDWLNGWMAALGVCVLLPDVRLSWTADPVPAACFTVPSQGRPVADLVAAALPSEDTLARLAINRRIEGRADLARTVALSAYADRASLARRTGDPSLSSTLTDLGDPQDLANLPHSPFDPAVPRGVTLWERVLSCYREVTDPVADVAKTFVGRGRRVAVNGLGFDVRRLTAGAQEADKRVDPVVELLAFYALSLFPMRGNGSGAFARGWHAAAPRTGSFRWCAWSASLDIWGVDALIDLLPLARQDPKLAKRLGITAWYHSVPYRPMSSSDMTRAYGAEAED